VIWSWPSVLSCASLDGDVGALAADAVASVVAPVVAPVVAAVRRSALTSVMPKMLFEILKITDGGET
jgi:hypothetical protein